MSQLRKLVVVALLALSGGATSWAVNLPFDAQENQDIKQFINTSGASLTSGTAVVFNYNSSLTTTGTAKGVSSSLGGEVTTTTVRNSTQFVGIMADDSCANNAVCRVITRGPALARYSCSSFNNNDVGTTVGTSTVAGEVGNGSRVGILLSLSTAGTATGGSNNCLRWIWVDPGNTSISGP